MRPSRTNARRPGGRLLAFSILAGVLSACDGSGEDRTESDPDREASDSGTSAEDPAALAPDPVVPPHDAERVEELHRLALPVLTAFLETMAGLRPHRSLGPFLSPEFASLSPLRPATMERVFDDGVTTVRRPDVYPRVNVDAAGFEPMVADLVSEYAPDGRGAHLKIVRVVPGPDPERFRVEVRARLDGRGLDDRLVQTAMIWDVELDLRPRDEQVRVRSLRVVSFLEAFTDRPPFLDVTDAVFGEVPRAECDLLLGAGEYRGRVDRLDGDPYLGHEGLAVGDVNGDGRDDVLLLQHGGLPNRLLLNREDGTAEDVSEASGLDFLERTQSALLLDLDADGDQDAVLAVGDAVRLALNDGSGRFTVDPRALPAGGTITSLSATDHDRDGDLDLFACLKDGGVSMRLWDHAGDDGWRDVTAEVGLDHASRAASIAALWEDLDRDGDPDLYVVKERGPNLYFVNEGGRFEERGAALGAADSEPGTGVTAADFDADGDVDLYVSNVFSAARLRLGDPRFSQATSGADGSGNTLLANDGTGAFSDETATSGAALSSWTWGAAAFDLNNDGRPDVYAPNGYLTADRDEDL